MKILLFSDSHGNIRNLIKAIHKNENIDMIIHLGDLVKDALYIKDLYQNIRFEIIQGNNDWLQNHLKDHLLEIEGKRIYLTHGHLFGVKQGYGNMIEKAKSLKADAVFFGHTHITEELYTDGMLLLNPGSICIPANSNIPTYCIVQIKENKIFSKFDSPLKHT